MSNELLSLREIGRRLNIPPSTVVYYKDRFSEFIPPYAGTGRRKKYPSEALTIFKEIRSMFENNWSAEQIEENLSQDFSHLFKPGNNGSTSGGQAGSGENDNRPALVNEITTVLDKMSGVLENQALFRTEIDTLRAEVTQLRKDKADLEVFYKDKIEGLEKELEEMQAERNELMRQFLEFANSQHDNLTQPPDTFLKLPLVIRTSEGEYLGVAGRTKHFNLSEFIRIVRSNTSARKTVSLQWQRRNKSWILTIFTNDLDNRCKHEHELQVFQTVTPNRNNVVQLTSLSIDGNSVPDPFLLVILRKIKDGFDD